MVKIYSSEDGELFWTTDLGLATALLVKYPLGELNARDPSKVAFGFKKDPGLEDYIRKFWNKELLVEPQTFYSELLMLRKRINQEINN